MEISKDLQPVSGFTYSAVNCGLKDKNEPDIMIICAEEPCPAAAVFTRNVIVAEPVKLSLKNMKNQKIQALVVNSSNANACTGDAGRRAAERELEIIAKTYGVAKSEIFISSTGVIGQPFPIEKVLKGITQLKAGLDSNKTSFENCARAIMTTDTTVKAASVRFALEGEQVTLSGISKGSGMIHPDMGTMLGFLLTDANISAPVLQMALRKAVDDSFNMISVDGDTSTNDCVLLMANGRAGNGEITEGDDNYQVFLQALTSLCQDLACQIVLDGEGATRFIEYRVTGLPDDDSAKQILKTIATSLLVKTAIFGKDPNWGRILAAAGRAGISFDPSEADLFMGRNKKVQLLKAGNPVSHKAEVLDDLFNSREQFIYLSLGSGRGEALGWGTDLSYEYVRINAEYTT